MVSGDEAGAAAGALTQDDAPPDVNARAPGAEHLTTHLPAPAFSRRALLLRAGALSAAGALGTALAGCRREDGAARRWAGRSLVVVTDGGAARLALWRAAFVPFERETGCRVMEIDNGGRDSGAELRRQVLRGQVQWDVAGLDASRVPALAADGLLQPLDDTAIPRAGLHAGFALEHAVGVLADTLAPAYRTEPFGPRSPATWVDVWDTATFPGPRAAPRNDVGLLEVALLADGVPPERLYPLDLDRAFRALDRLRPAVGLWWRKPDQARLALAEGVVDVAIARGGELRWALADGAAARLPAPPAPLLPVCWGVPRDAPNGDVARDFIAYTLRPAVQSAIAAAGFVPALASHATTPPAEAFAPDLAWWATNGRAATARFEQWIGR